MVRREKGDGEAEDRSPEVQVTEGEGENRVAAVGGVGLHVGGRSKHGGVAVPLCGRGESVSFNCL
jgi:hypothetical protein